MLFETCSEFQKCFHMTNCTWMMIYVCTKKILTEICLRTLDLGTKTHICIEIRKEGCEKINCRFRFVIMDRAQLKTIHILRKHIFRFLTPFPPTSIFSVLIKTYSENIVVDTVVISYFTYYDFLWIRRYYTQRTSINVEETLSK